MSMTKEVFFSLDITHRRICCNEKISFCLHSVDENQTKKVFLEACNLNKNKNFMTTL